MKKKRYFNAMLAERLCDRISGSGLDTTPTILDGRPRSVLVAWDFHLMDGHGSYDGYWAFTLSVPRDNPMEFKIRGKSGNPRTLSALDIKDYLYEAFSAVLSETLDEAGVGCELINDKIYPGDPDYDSELPFAKEHGYHFGRAHYEYSNELEE